jgi:hypothetical protein
MDYADLIPDFVRRTLANLDLVKRAAAAGDPSAFEVTQLWNSLLGLVVAPREKDVGSLPRTRLPELYAQGWPVITRGGALQDETLVGLVSAMRIAIAHFHVEFQADSEGVIQGVALWNVKTDEKGRPIPDGPHRWDGRLGVAELEKLARNIAGTYLMTFGRRAA